MAGIEDFSPETRDEMARLLHEMSENPETREQVLRLTKQVRPSMTIDSIELKDQMNSSLEQSNRRVEMLEQKLRQKELEAELQAKRRSLVENGKASSLDEVAEIEKVMVEKRIADHETAAEYHAYMKEAARPTPSQFSSSNVMNESARDMLAKFWKNPAAAARDEAAKALTDIRRGNARPIGI
jgi:hypothetical protein